MTMALLSPAEVVSLQRTIEAGVLARAAYASGDRPLGATDEELILLAELGEQARQRFIRANLRLVADGGPADGHPEQPVRRPTSTRRAASA